MNECSTNTYVGTHTHTVHGMFNSDFIRNLLWAVKKLSQSVSTWQRWTTYGGTFFRTRCMYDVSRPWTIYRMAKKRAVSLANVSKKRGATLPFSSRFARIKATVTDFSTPSSKVVTKSSLKIPQYTLTCEIIGVFLTCLPMTRFSAPSFHQRTNWCLRHWQTCSQVLTVKVQVQVDSQH